MKKFIMFLLVAAFAFSPLIQSDAKAAPQPKTMAGKHLKKANVRLKHKVKQLRHKLHKARRHGHHKSA